MTWCLIGRWYQQRIAIMLIPERAWKVAAARGWYILARDSTFA